MFGNRTKMLLFFIGDIIALYLALFLTLLIRYGSSFYDEFVNAHAFPFSVAFVAWIVIFYIAGLYDLRRLRNDIEFLKTLFLAIVIDILFAVLLFYLVPSFGIAPKTNLIIFAVIFAVVEIIWRRIANAVLGSGEAQNRVLLIGNTATAMQVKNAIAANPQLGYAIKAEIDESSADASPENVKTIVARENITLVVVPQHLKREPKLVTVLYGLFGQGVTVIDLPTFYESIMRKVPLADLEETWFLENIQGAARFYDPMKRAGEFVIALVLFVVLSPIELVIAVLVRLTSPGPIIYRQVRVGERGKEFTLYKFRNMRADAEKDGPRWAQTENDPRTTPIGNFLRKSHLDELPQLVNILKGEMSFVGPRPERPEFVKTLKEKVPYYEVRLLVKPGVTGWAQLNHHADTTTEDVVEKLQYDIYYLKHRAPLLDALIMLRTFKSFFVSPK